MQITRVVGFLFLVAISIVGCLFAVWRFRRRRLLAVGLVVASALLAFSAGVGAWAWATTRTVPQGIVYDGQGWYPEWSPAPPSEATCVRIGALRHGLEWPLRRVGRIAWVTWNSNTSVERSGRGYAVFESSQGNEIYVEVNPDCYLPYVSV